MFTLEEFLATVDSGVSERTRYLNLRNAVRRGQAYRIKRGLYASNLGVYRDQVPNVYLVASKVADDALISHHSALEALGVAHSPSRSLYLTSASKVGSFEVRGYRFRRVEPPTLSSGTLDTYTTQVRAGASLVRVTSKERTLVDCLREPRLAGGLEELLRSLGGFVSMSAEASWEYARLLDSPTAVARLGWALDLFDDVWQPERATLEGMRESLGRGNFRLASHTESAVFVSRWRLYVPADLPYQEWARG